MSPDWGDAPASTRTEALLLSWVWPEGSFSTFAVDLATPQVGELTPITSALCRL
jgi:hypothetical protein